MLVEKNKGVSLRWERNFLSCGFCENNLLFCKPALPPCQAVTSQELSKHPRETRGVWGFKLKCAIVYRTKRKPNIYYSV